MRIIGGIAAGTRLCSPKGRSIRPTSGRVKEALFSALGDITDWTVVDLYAGTGALGLEAWSRGAGNVVCVDRASAAVQAMRENLSRCRRAAGAVAGPGPSIVRADVAAAPSTLADLAGAVDLVLADPPYRPGPHDFGAVKMLRDAGIAAWAAGALLALEHATGTELPWYPQSPWHLLNRRRYGSRSLSYARCGDA